MMLGAGFTLFLGLMGYLVASSTARRTTPVHAPTPLARVRPAVPPGGADTLTIDARDERAWRFVDLARGAQLLAPDTAGWDLAVRRYYIIAGGGGAIADLGAVGFDAVTRAPSAGYVANTVGRSDTSNAAVRRWYDYGFTSHLLEPKPRVYVVRTADGAYAKVQILGYYCPGLQGGCLTLRYAPVAPPRG
jgi:hypothetical protein